MTDDEALALAIEHVDTFDLLLADRVPEQRAANLILAALKSGRDPRATAEHFIKLRKAYRGEL